MALAALKARRAVREMAEKRVEGQRLREEEHLKEEKRQKDNAEDDYLKKQKRIEAGHLEAATKIELQRVEDEKVERETRETYRKQLEEFEEDLRRFEEEEEQSTPLMDGYRGLTVRGNERSHDEIDGQDMFDVEVEGQGVEDQAVQDQQRTTERTVQDDLGDTLHRHENLMEMYENGIDMDVDSDSGIDCTSVQEESMLEGVDELSRPPYTPIKIYVGSDGIREEFILPKDSLMKHSSYFNEILSYGIDDDSDNEQTVILPDVPIQTFTIFANFIRFGYILSSQPGDFQLYHSPYGDYHHDAEWPRLAAAWHLGDRLCTTTFRDAVVDALTLKVNRDHSWPIDLYKSSYTSAIPRVTGIKRLLVDLALFLWDKETLQLEELEDSRERFCEFFEDLLERREEVERRAEMGLGVEMGWLEGDGPDLWVTGGGVYWQGEKEEKGKGGKVDEVDDEDDEEMFEVKAEEDADEEVEEKAKQEEMVKGM